MPNPPVKEFHLISPRSQRSNGSFASVATASVATSPSFDDELEVLQCLAGSTGGGIFLEDLVEELEEIESSFLGETGGSSSVVHRPALVSKDGGQLKSDSLD